MENKNIEHIAFIMDGNSTWAKQQGKDILDGYLAGMRRLANIICDINDMGIRYTTYYAFSSENWFRPKSWIDSFMNLAVKFLESDPSIQKVLDAKIKLKVIGDKDRLPKNLQNIIHKYEDMTTNNTGTIMQLAMSYGGREEIVRAVKKLNKHNLDITEDNISKNLDTAGIPDPELIIRTSSKKRLSNFLLWQASYSELYVSDVLWPDFDKTELLKAIDDFSKRIRTYGR